MFENYKVFNYEYAGRPLKVEVGKVAGLANGSCMISYGETVILACATASPKPRDGIDFLPLSVDYDEKLYARQNSGKLYKKRRQTRRKGYPYKPCYRPSYPSPFPEGSPQRCCSYPHGNER